MGIGNSGEQESSRNAVFGPEMDLVKRHEKNICTGSPVFRALGQLPYGVYGRWQEALSGRII